MNVEFGDAVRYARKQCGYSQEQLARKLNVSFATVNRWESGKSSPRPIAEKAFLKLCKIKKIDISQYKGKDA